MFPYPHHHGIGVTKQIYTPYGGVVGVSQPGTPMKGVAQIYAPYGGVVGVPRPGTPMKGVAQIYAPYGGVVGVSRPGTPMKGGVAPPRPIFLSPAMDGAYCLWSKHRHDDGRIYYYNKMTKQSVWTKPEELKTPAEKAASWKEYTTDDGKTYYHNTSTKETSWAVPKGFKSATGVNAGSEGKKADTKEEEENTKGREEGGGAEEGKKGGEKEDGGDEMDIDEGNVEGGGSEEGKVVATTGEEREEEGEKMDIDEGEKMYIDDGEKLYIDEGKEEEGRTEEGKKGEEKEDGGDEMDIEEGENVVTNEEGESSERKEAGGEKNEGKEAGGENDEGRDEAEQSGSDTVIAASPIPLVNNNSIGVVSLSHVPLVDAKAELRKRQSERFTDMLRDKYKDGKITLACSWDKAAPFLQSDPRFRILTKVSEKKQLFNAWKVQKEKEERDQKRMAVRKAKEDLENWLITHPMMRKSELLYRKAHEMFKSEAIWNAVEEDERREIFRDSHMAVTKKVDVIKEDLAQRQAKAFADLLEKMGEITYRTTWYEMQQLFIAPHRIEEFRANRLVQKMLPIEALAVFEKHIRNLEKKHDEEKKSAEKMRKRRERKNREAFQRLLEELHEKGELTHSSKWSSLHATISADARYDPVIRQSIDSGSTPLDLFKFYQEDLKEQYDNDWKIVKAIIAAEAKSVDGKTPFEELIEWVHQFEKGRKVSMANLKMFYNFLVAESVRNEKMREMAMEKRRVEGEFRNLLKSMQPPIGAETEWSAVRAHIEEEPSFKAMGSEEEREDIFKALAKGHH